MSKSCLARITLLRNQGLGTLITLELTMHHACPLTPGYTFDDDEAGVFSKLRNSWIIKKRFRPYVPILEGVAPPSPSKPAEDNAKYLSLFFRPWTLGEATPSIPHLARLGVPVQRAGQLDSEATTIGTSTSFKRAWREYVRGNVVSESAAAFIRSFLTKTMARSRLFEADDGNEPDKSDIDDDVPPFLLSSDRARTLIHGAHGDEDGTATNSISTRKRRKTRAKGFESRRVTTATVPALR